MHQILCAALCVAGGLVLVGCRITPDEIRVIEAENELLRTQIQTVKENCTYYRELDVRPEREEEEE